MANARDIFLRAIDCTSPDERARLIGDACGEDAALKRRVVALLSAHDDPDSYLERPAARFDVTATHDGSGSHLSDSSSSHHGRFLPGTKIAGRYRIVSMLGRGGMGEVYRADDLRLGQTVALKFLPPELAKDAKRLEYFHNEVRLARQIAHPNVCRVYDIGEVDGQHFISMEYIDGEDLKTLLRRIGRLPKDKGIQIAQQLCSGLSAAHSKGVLHRDLKPANIMVDGQGQVRITDFGLATVSADGENIVGMSGTPAYMSPEQVLRGHTSVRSDLYSLGLVLFEIFTGKMVYGECTLDDLRRRHAESSSPSDQSEALRDLDPAICSGLMRCLQPDPSDRPGSIDELSMWLPGGDALAAALAAGDVPSPDMVATAQTTRHFSQWHTYVAMVAILVGIACVMYLARKAVLVKQLDSVAAPSVLAHKATELLDRFGYSESLRDQAVGIASPQLLDASDVNTLRNSNAYFDGVWFWLRSSPVALASIAPFDHKARVDEAHPAWNEEQMNGVRLDMAGNLRWFRHVPEKSSYAPDETGTPDWQKWFDRESIGFDLGILKEASIVDLPPDPYDAISAWEGDVADLGPLRVTAATCGGKPTFFTVERLGPAPSNSDVQSEIAEELTGTVVCLIALVFAYAHKRMSICYERKDNLLDRYRNRFDGRAR